MMRKTERPQKREAPKSARFARAFAYGVLFSFLFECLPGQQELFCLSLCRAACLPVRRQPFLSFFCAKKSLRRYYLQRRGFYNYYCRQTLRKTRVLFFFCRTAAFFLPGKRFRVRRNEFRTAVFLSVRINAVRVRSHYFVVSVVPLSAEVGSSGCVGVGCSDFAASTVLAAESPSLYEAEASTVTRSPTLNSAARLERVAAV